MKDKKSLKEKTEEIVEALLRPPKMIHLQVNKIATTPESLKKRIVYGIVLKPNVEDAHGDIISPEEIEKSAHQYLVHYRHVGEAHIEFADVDVVESYVAPVNFKIGEREISKGTWVMAVKIWNPDLWAKVENGQLTAFSPGGTVLVEPK